jgi:hypothetical protein
VHTDPASLDYHMDVAGPRFGRFGDLVTLRSINIYGEPSEKALAQLRDKVRLLGNGEVTVHAPHAGFGRLALSGRPATALEHLIDGGTNSVREFHHAGVST